MYNHSQTEYCSQNDDKDESSLDQLTEEEEKIVLTLTNTCTIQMSGYDYQS